MLFPSKDIPMLLGAAKNLKLLTIAAVIIFGLCTNAGAAERVVLGELFTSGS